MEPKNGTADLSPSFMPALSVIQQAEQGTISCSRMANYHMLVTQAEYFLHDVIPFPRLLVLTLVYINLINSVTTRLFSVSLIMPVCLC